jgi:hypothetical protein
MCGCQIGSKYPIIHVDRTRRILFISVMPRVGLPALVRWQLVCVSRLREAIARRALPWGQQVLLG